MKNIFKIGLISRFVMLFLFMLGLNTALSTPALAAGDSYEIDFFCNDGNLAAMLFLGEGFDCSEITVPTTCDGKTVLSWKDTGHSGGTNILSQDVCDYARYILADDTFIALWPETYQAPTFTVEYCMPFSHTQADFDRCVLNGDCDVCDPITIDETKCPSRSSSFDNSSYTGGAEKFYVPALDTKVGAGDITQCELLYAINESGNSDHRLIQSDWSDYSTGESVPTGYKRVKFYTSSNSYITERDYYMGEYAGTLPTASELGLSAVSGKDFVGWTLKGDANCNIDLGVIDTSSVVVEPLSACSSTVFTATAAYADKVKIQFYANGGTGSAPTYTCNMKSCILPQNTYTKTGYKFTKWLVEDGAINFGSNELFNAGTNIVSEFKSDQSNVGITLTPQWEATCNAITIRGSTRGGSGTYTIYKKTGSSTVYSNPTCTTVLSSVPSELKTSLTKTNAMFAGTTNDCIKAEEASHSSVNLTFNTASSCNATGATTWDARFYCNGYYRGAGKNITGACTGSYINFIYANDKNASSTKTTQVCQYGGPCSTYNIKDIYGNNVGYTASSYLHNCLTPPYAAGYCDQGNTVEFAVAEETSLQSSIKSYIDDFLSDQPGHEEVYGEDLVVALYPHWIAVTNTLKIYANASDSSPYSTKSCPYGATAATCDPESARPSKKGYTLLGYCRGKNNSCSDMIPVGDNSISTLATGSVTIELTAVWDLNIYKVNLDPNYYASASASASGKVSLSSPTVIFEKYGTGWYSDQNATTAFTKLTKLPKYSTYVFQGFYTAKAGTGTRIIDQAGNLVAANTVYDTAGATTNKTAYAKYAACTCTKGTNVSACTVDSTNDSNQCVYNVTCASGYTNASNVGAAGVANNTMNCGTASTYTITFDANGGSGGQSGTKSVTYAAALPTISTTKPTKTGYTFAGWYDSATAGKQYYDENGAAKISAYDKTSNTTLYAHWTANTYTIVLFKNDGTIASTTTSVTFGGQIPASVTVPTRTGYNFKGYYTTESAAGVQYYDNTGARVYTNKWAIASGTNLYAHWTPIEYTCGGGDYLPAKATSCADCLSGHYCPGGTYSFNETSDQGIGVCPIGTFDTHTMDSCTPCGRGTTNTNDNRTTCIACPNTNNGVESWQQTSWSADTGMVGLCTITACKTGYTFSGAGENTKCTANTYTVTLNVNGGAGGSPASVTATYDSNMPKLTSVPTRAHYTLAGYYDAQSGGNKYYNADGTSAKVWDKTSNTTLYAHWTPDIYTITLVSFPESNSIVKVNTTDANPNKLYVKYGVDVCSDERCRTSVSKITPPSNDAAAFTGFYTTEAGTGTALITADGSFNATTFKNATTNSTLYAGWTTKITECSAGKYLPKGSNTCASCLAGYYCEGGKYAYNTTANQGLTGVCASGYSTGGATTSTCSACNTGYAATGTAATNHDAADDCKPITYYINYSCNGGTGSAPAKVTAKYDTGYTAAANSCTKTGYSFTGWKCTGGGTSCDGDIIQVDGSIKNITATNGTSINMTAQWSANTYQVCFNANGGSGMPSCVTATYDEPMPSVNLDKVKRTGFTFLGIYDSADKKYYNTNGSPAVEAWDKASDTTLIAKWDADPIRCTAMYYLPANSIECKKCEAGYYCPDTDTYTYNATQAQGRKQCSQSNQYSTEGRQYCLTCPDGGVVRDVNANGLQDAASECYKEVDYVAAHGIGKQTCYYSATDSEYNLNCYDKSITACATGYELENSTDLDCKLITYNVVYYDGSTKLTNFNSSAYQYSIEAPITTLPTPQKEGYQFVGWYTNSNLTGTPVTQITSSGTGNKTLYAKYVSLAKVTLYLDAGPCTAPENKSITIYENQLDELYTILTSDKNVPNCDNIGGTYHGFYYIDLGEDTDPCMINSDGACNGLVVDGDTLSAYVTYDPIICAAGTYLRAGWISSCTECPAGSYCGGSGENGFWWDKNKDQGIEKCPTNYTSYAGKAADKTDCYAVLEPGKYVKNAGDTTFATCPAGSFCPGTDIINYGEAGGAKKCWSGNYCPETGMAEQTPCPAGYHCPDSGMTQPTVCSGSTYTETTGKSSCDACPSGYSIADSAKDYTDHDKKSDCKITCAAGYYLESNANACTKVGYNYYSNGGTVGYGYNLIRSECPDGGLTSTETANSSASCYVVNECDLANGTGTQSCSYTSGGYTNCGDCSLTTCDNGFIKDASGECVARPITIKYLCDGENVSETQICYVTDEKCRLNYTGCTKTGHTLDTWAIDADGYADDIVSPGIDLIDYGFIPYLESDVGTAFWDDGAYILVTPNSWNANKITVKYQVNGKIVKTVECAYGSACNVATDIATPTQVGGIFAGWGDEDTIYAPGDALNLPESGEYLLRAEFNPIKYAIGYHQNTGVGEQIAHTQDCEYDQGCKLTTSFYTKDGSAFLGWSTDPNATTAEYKSGASVMNLTATDGDVVTLYAVYGPCTPCSTAAGVLCRLSTETGACVYQSGCNTGYNLTSGQNTANPVCSAQELVIPIYRTEIAVEPYHTLKVFYGGGMPETVSIPDAREGYTFTGLIGDDGIIYYDNNGNRQNNNGYPSKLTAVWTANSYTVTYDANKPVGATENVSGAVESTQHIYDEPKTVGQNTYSLRGYTSNGWNTKADGSGTQIESGQTVQNLTATNDGSVTLYSQWTKNTITIKLDDDLGDTSYTETSCKYGDKFTLPGTYRTGYTGYWAGSKNYFVPYQEYDCTYDNLGVYEGEVTLATTWTPYTYTVSFNANGGSGNMNNQSFTYDVAQNLKANEFTRSDYLFAGWNTSADGKGTPYSDGASVVNLTDVKDGNVTLYAQWLQNIYTINVNYSCDGFGTAPAPMTCKSSDASCLLAQSTCKKDGYVFVGWLFDGSEQFAGTNISSYITLSNHAKTFNATAVYAETAFTMTVKPLSDGTAGFILGNGVKGGFAVDWGDGTSTAFNKTSSSVQNVTHVYSDVNREYLVQVASVADSVNDQSIKYGISSLYVSSDLAPTVIKLGGSLGKLFQGSKMSLFKDSFKSATNLIEISPTLFNGFTTVQKNFADSMFASCVSLPTMPLNLFVGITPASGATNIFTQMFAGCTELATITNQNGGKTPFIPMDFVYDILPSFQTSQFALMLTGTSLLSNCPDGFVTNKTVSKPVCQPNEFTITTTDNTSSFDFALSAAGTYYIDWGDSTQVVTLDAPVSSSAMHTVSHTYKTAGKYKIQFAGQATKYYPDGQWGMNTSAISFANNTNVAEIDGSLGAIFATLTSGEQTQPRFKETFKGNTSLNGSIPETLLDGIHGQPSRRMFQDMFRGCTNLGGSIPSNMFANLSGTPTDYLFSGTFADCKNLSGQIPAFDTFAGTLTAEQNTKAFGATFWNAGVGADENGTPLFLPDNLFDGLNPSGFVAKQMELIFTGTKFATECPNNMYKVTATENPFVADWADKAMCNACPLDSLRTVSSVVGENNGATSCFVTCPENITITNGTTSVVKSVLNYTGTSYPSCTYNAQCDTGYDVQNNGTSNPTCGANTYTVTYQTDTQTVVDVVYGQQFEFNQPVPEKVGYTKVGWLDNNGKLYAINETITYNMAYNISVVPQYTANKYVATYDCDNASENITEEITYDADYTLKTNVCTKQGYAFVGWTVDGNLVANSFKWTYPSDTVFIAKWNPLTYDVTYDCGEGTGAAPSNTNVAYDSDFTTAANTCTNVGYNFVGWKVSDTDNSFGADETFSWTYLENKTFVAQWNAQKITCQSGQYLDKTNCLSCDAGYKCPAEPITYTYDGTIQGRVACSGATEYQNQPGQTMCKIVDDGYYKTSDTTQVQCGNNYYCKNSVRTQCADGGITDTVTASAATQCYKTGVACTTVGGFGTNTCNYNLTTKDYTDCAQCIVDGCDDGYYLDNGTCVICPVGSYCANSVRTSCPINYTTKQTGAVTDVECFTTCSDKEVVYGTAYADNPEVFWPAACTHTYGISVTGNACKIVDNVCVETACNYNYEMINGKCELCVRDNALSFKQGAGNCIVETCLYGYYPFGQSCVGDTRECSVAGAVYAEQKWNPKTNSFGPCEIKECSEGTHIDANTCVPDVQSCELEHGTGEKIYNNQLNKWGDCIATSCMPGYTNDPKLTNETWKQCGQCNNRFGTSGEPVVSTYVSGCEIATCMYQGEKYILENNECRLICDERNDETGSRYWNGSKCVHNCNPGFLAW